MSGFSEICRLTFFRRRLGEDLLYTQHYEATNPPTPTVDAPPF